MTISDVRLLNPENLSTEHLVEYADLLAQELLHAERVLGKRKQVVEYVNTVELPAR